MNTALHSDEDLAALPGGALVARGRDDLAAGRETAEALLVLIGSRRMQNAGLPVPTAGFDVESADYRLYARLAAEHGNDAHARYNSLLRELVSFERALERAYLRLR